MLKKLTNKIYKHFENSKYNLIYIDYKEGCLISKLTKKELLITITIYIYNFIYIVRLETRKFLLSLYLE